MSAVTTTTAFIGRHARERPSAQAVWLHGLGISYARLYGDVLRFCTALQGLGVGHGTRVLVVCDQPYVHWLLQLACEHLGACSDAAPHADDALCATLDARADLLLVQGDRPPPTHRCRVWPIDQGWVDAVLALPEPAPMAAAARSADDPARVGRTSGTTGVTKRVMITEAGREARVERYREVMGFAESSRLLLVTHMSAVMSCHHAHALARAGGTLVIAPGGDTWQAVHTQAVTHMFCLPGMLAQWLAGLPAAFVKPAGLHISCTGAAVPPALRAQALYRLATSFEDIYASNETGLIATGMSTGADGTGSLLPGVQAQVVDSGGTPLPHGEPGLLRVRAPYMTPAYLDDAQGSAQFFHDGWFQPGDMAVMPAAGRLRLTGRAVDVLNLGGIKVAPSDIEAIARTHLGAGIEVAACTVPDAQGVSEVWLAFAGDMQTQRPGADAALKALCGQFHWVRFHVVGLPALPRTPKGETDRAALRQTVGRIAAS